MPDARYLIPSACLLSLDYCLLFLVSCLLFTVCCLLATDRGNKSGSVLSNQVRTKRKEKKYALRTRINHCGTHDSSRNTGLVTHQRPVQGSSEHRNGFRQRTDLPGHSAPGLPEAGDARHQAVPRSPERRELRHHHSKPDTGPDRRGDRRGRQEHHFRQKIPSQEQRSHVRGERLRQRPVQWVEDGKRPDT
ncbi:MAG TPA: hypothetical protein DCO77_08640 [Nitrospiraceae bacterium]|nr:hypothetical protein [Nitrospiraceae bacterium]